mmetsp:Transcript_52896/g.84287  ORF Transcript_52896/g.84287 Transcript_52896/m.84287 type:complete len:109 (+) Transcript_52896:273-599(+)
MNVHEKEGSDDDDELDELMERAVDEHVVDREVVELFEMLWSSARPNRFGSELFANWLLAHLLPMLVLVLVVVVLRLVQLSLSEDHHDSQNEAANDPLGSMSIGIDGGG